MVSLHDLSCTELTAVQESRAMLNLAAHVLSEFAPLYDS